MLSQDGADVLSDGVGVGVTVPVATLVGVCVGVAVVVGVVVTVVVVVPVGVVVAVPVGVDVLVGVTVPVTPVDAAVYSYAPMSAVGSADVYRAVPIKSEPIPSTVPAASLAGDATEIRYAFGSVDGVPMNCGFPTTSPVPSAFIQSSGASDHRL